jgi:L-lysine 2,3-aminomutase
VNGFPCPIPLALIAEITHRCPLHCVYCSNPLELTSRNEELADRRLAAVFAKPPRLASCIFTSPEVSRWRVRIWPN